jgi:hypothetical protein
MSAVTKRTTDHDTIREWAEKRAGVPATESGELIIDFPGGAGEDALEHISWDDWFRKFDEKNLCFIFQEEKVSGEGSMFFTLARRD